MTLEELESYLNDRNRVFLEASEEVIKYTFHSKTIGMNNIPDCKWELKEEDGRFYIETMPPIKGEEYRLMWINIVSKNPLRLQLTSKMTNKHFIDLIEVVPY